MGIDESAPLLAWKLTGSGRARRQTGYQIRLIEVTDHAALEAWDPADDDHDVAWDSGLVHSGETHDIRYAGPPLRSRTRYAWSVRVVDESGRESAWSPPAEFEMGLTSEKDWSDGIRADWIGSAEDATLADAVSLDYVSPHRHVERIWLPSTRQHDGAAPARLAYFRSRIDVPGDQVPVAVRLAADAGNAELQAYFDDEPIPTDGSRRSVDGGAGRHVVAIRVSYPDGSEPPGLAAGLRLEFADHPALMVGTDGTWRCAAAEEESWTRVDHDDGHWALAEKISLHGTAPHGRSPLTYRPSPYLRKEFVVSTPVVKARLYATALGLYEARLNGARIGNERLSPGWTDYDHRVPYQTYDVTEHVVEGRNVLGAVLADGWYAGNVGWLGQFQWGKQRLFLARLELEHADGTRTIVATDHSWRVGSGAIRYADLQNGEVVDARAEPQGWDASGFDDSSWPEVVVATPTHGRLEARVAPPITVQHELSPVSIENRGSGRWIVDFGQNLVGWVRLRVAGEAGSRVLVRHAEVLDHKRELYVEALRGARATDEFILSGAEAGEVFEPRFTVHGFRYVEVSGYPGELRPDDITACVAYAAMEQIGELECSDPRINKLQQNIVWGQRGNFLAVPTDCPQRDERLGWTGDAQVFAATAAFNYDVRSFLRKWLRDLRDGQQPDGGVPHVAPDIMTRYSKRHGDGRQETGAAGWGDAIVIVPWELLRAYDDKRAARESFDAIRLWLDYLRHNSSDFVRPNAGFADWLAPIETPKDLVSTAFFAYVAKLAAQLADVLGETSDATAYRDLFARVRQAFRDRFVRGGGQLVSGTQTAYVLALHIGLLEPDEEPLAARRLVDEIESRNWHLATGFLGTPYLLPVLSRFGYDDVAFRLLTQETYPSWLYPVVAGDATTMWERWDSWSDSRGFQDARMTSFNHYAYGAVGEWMYQNIGGIAPAEFGYSTVRIRPRVGGGITSARCVLETVHGTVSTHWRTEDDGFELDVVVPPNVTADVWLPTVGVETVTEGGRKLGDVEHVDVVTGAGDEVVVRTGSGSYSFRAAFSRQPSDGQRRPAGAARSV
ncbi:MAG TPA: family 78 glycoside hydrolase catalytic domain [Actinopolymorphaceae bacterium]